MSSNYRRFCLLPLAIVASCTTPPKDPQAPNGPATEAPESVMDARYSALPTPSAALNWDPPPVSKARLDNGLEVWHMPTSGAPLVSVHLVLPVGSAEDPRGKEGLTLLAADLLDEGAGSRSALELSERLGELATEYSSSGGVDWVLLSMDALAENLDPSLALLSDIVLRPQLRENEFDRRKKHYEASALASRDDPRAARGKGLNHALFGEDYASRAETGTTKSLAAISYQDAKRRAKQLTVPEGAHLTFAGAVDAQEAERLARKYFGEWRGKRVSTQPQVSDKPSGGVAYVIDFPGAAQSSLAVAKRAGAEGDPAQFAEDVMQDKLGGSFTGRINMNLREDKGYTYGAFSYFRRHRHAGFFAIMADVRSETTAASISEIHSELEAICAARPLSDEERDDAVNGMLLGYPLEFDQVSSVGYRLAALPMKGRAADYWSTWPENIASITTQRANEAARPYCRPSEYLVVVAGDRRSVAPELEKLGLLLVAMDREGSLLASDEQGNARQTASPSPSRVR